MIDYSTLKTWALELGFSQAALCHVNDFCNEESIVSQQQPLKERQQLLFHPVAEYPRTKSLLVLLWSYESGSLPSGDQVFIDPYYYASNAAYHAARKLEERLILHGCFAKANVSFPAKAAAVRAGLGIIGRNNLLITKEYGTRVVIILMATDIETDNMPPIRSETLDCLQCGRCQKACPSGALNETGMHAPHRCLRNFMMEGIVVPEAVRNQIGMNLIGCDMCQRVCPMQPDKIVSSIDQSFFLSEFMTDNENAFSKTVERLAERIGRNTARPQRIRAQAALLAGNSMNPEYLPVLRSWAQSPFDAVREHADWAIRRIEESQKSPARP